MDPEEVKRFTNIYRKSLLEDVIPFWQHYSPDWEKGGYFTCLDAEGNVFDQDKFVWLQARQVWTFSMLFIQLEARSEWLEIARLGVDFLDKYAFDEQGDCFFALDRNGQPLVKAYNIFSDCFMAMAYARYGQAAQKSWFIHRSKQIFQSILERKGNPKGVYNKQVTENRPLKNFALPMILCNLSLELENVLPSDTVEKTIDDCLDEIMNDFLDDKKGIIYENVLHDGTRSDSFDGRLINPGHGIEACWFLMDVAERRGDSILLKKCVNICLSLLEYGWDKEFDGIFYFLDVDGHPPQQLEWDQKLWWVHLEALVALSKAYRLTGDPRCVRWFKRLHDYTWEHFRDPQGGMEWYGYLNRQGQVLLKLKGGKWKGCFHVPRALYLCMQEFDKLSRPAQQIKTA